MRYLPKSDAERREMLDSMGLATLEDLFAQLPDEVRLKRPLRIPPGQSEYEIIDYFRERAAENANGYASFLGAGAYHHYRPVVIDALVQRGEFLTAYTPYQPEISQGTLTSIFEFQTMLCQLTGMEVANASMYDGSTALPEAVMMACRVTGRTRAVVARSVHPEYRQVHHTYARHQGLPIAEAPYDPATGSVDLAALEGLVDEATAAVVVQNPNFFGCLEPVRDAARIAHAKGALLVVIFTEAVSLGLLEPPVDADIVAGELQSFAITPAYGGPYVGVMAAKERFIRQMPGRLVGQTTDSEGNRAFCLTLATREQHIRREKATSNICTNQALVALMATIFMSVYGKQGLRELASQNVAKAHFLASKLGEKGVKTRFSAPFFNEFVVARGPRDPAALLANGIIGGLDLARFYPELSGCALLCATETARRQTMERLVELW
jgi:glycine dehydrogenase subunit 1